MNMTKSFCLSDSSGPQPGPSPPPHQDCFVSGSPYPRIKSRGCCPPVQDHPLLHFPIPPTPSTARRLHRVCSCVHGLGACLAHCPTISHWATSRRSCHAPAPPRLQGTTCLFLSAYQTSLWCIFHMPCYLSLFLCHLPQVYM